MKLKIATRSSKLALWQSNWIKDQIQTRFSDVEVELVLIKTQGDKILDTPLSKIGGKGLFVKELENAMLDEEADLAVHSMKDVPTELPSGLEISVITKREEPADAFVSNHYSCFTDLPANALIGTSSLRRISQLKSQRPDLRFESLRGNVDTRLKKLDQGNYDAIILAGAGLKRLGWEKRITELLSVDLCLPAIAQGAVGIESRVGDEKVLSYLRFLQDTETTHRVNAERAFLKRMNGGCQVPLAAYAVLDGDLTLDGLVASPDGSQVLQEKISGSPQNAEKMGIELAEVLLDLGGRNILAEVGITAD